MASRRRVMLHHGSVSFESGVGTARRVIRLHVRIEKAAGMQTGIRVSARIS